MLVSAAEGSGDFVLILNDEGVVCQANPASRTSFPEGLEGRDAIDIVDSLSREALQRAIDRVCNGGSTLVEVTVGPPRRSIEFSVVRVVSDGHAWTVLVGRARLLALQVEQHLGELNRRYDDKVRELASLTGKLRELATTDSLTNLFNRRAFIDRAEAEWARAARHNVVLSCVVIDIDQFKRVNDQHGHATGDEVIRLVGSLIRTTVRTSDIPARLGGEEFVALLPQTTLQGAVLLSERVRSRIGEHAVRNPAGLEVRVTCSAGVASTVQGYRTFSELLGAADAALYAAKAGGRDCVCVAPELFPLAGMR